MKNEENNINIIEYSRKFCDQIERALEIWIDFLQMHLFTTKFGNGNSILLNAPKIQI